VRQLVIKVLNSVASSWHFISTY